MASIPPTWLASNIQGSSAQQRAAEARDRDVADAARKAGGESPFARELTDAIETSDQVDAEGQGGGGQGRESGAGDDAENEENPSGNSPPVTPGSSLDIEA